MWVHDAVQAELTPWLEARGFAYRNGAWFGPGNNPMVALLDGLALVCEDRPVPHPAATVVTAVHYRFQYCDPRFPGDLLARLEQLLAGPGP